MTNEKTKRKPPERRPAGIKAMPAPPTRVLPDDHPARTMFKQARDETPTTSTTTTGTTPTTPVAPTRDFQRVPNSITRHAVPAGLFSGKGKQVYDYLYSVTRGAVVPVRSVRIPMDELAVRSGVGSDRTLRKHIRRLEAVGLVRVNEIGGTQGGNEFTVFIPEEISTPTTGTTAPTTYHGYHPSPELPVVRVVESDSGTGGLSSGVQRTSDESNTLLNTNTEKTIDDEAAPRPSTPDHAAFLGLLELFSQTSTEITGKPPSAVDHDHWRDLAKLLTTELKIAAGRAESVSSVPAFLTEHLRRRLWKKERREIEREATEARSQVKSAQGIDITACPDCHGEKYFYPEGYDKGIKFCTHEKLTSKT